MLRRDRAALLRVAYVADAVLDTWLSGDDSTAAARARRVTKPLLMPTLATSLVVDERARRSPLFGTTVLALLGGWGGDLALLREGTGAFLTGVGSFAAGHLAYIFGFTRRRAEEGLLVRPRGRLLAATTVVLGPTLALAAARRQRELGLPVLAYAGLLGHLAATAGRLSPELSRSARRLTSAGSLLFLVSDTALATTRFVLADDDPRGERLVMATYAAAQLLLAEGARAAAP